MNHTIPPLDKPQLPVVDRLRTAIVSGQLQPGQALRQDALAEQYRLSKIPLREALNQLKAEGLVTFINNRGAMVSRLSAAEVDEIYTMRIALESLALERGGMVWFIMKIV